MIVNSNVTMRKNRRRNEDGRPRGEFDDQLEVPQNQVPAGLMVEKAERRNCAPAVGEVGKVLVRISRGGRAKVVGGGGEDGWIAWKLKIGVFGFQG